VYVLGKYERLVPSRFLDRTTIPWSVTWTHTCPHSNPTVHRSILLFSLRGRGGYHAGSKRLAKCAYTSTRAVASGSCDSTQPTVMSPVTSARDHHPHHLSRPIRKSHADSRTQRVASRHVLARAWERLESCEQRAQVHPSPRGSKHPYGMIASRCIHHCNVHSVRSGSP
jgi:hypothetical protein